MCNASPNSEDSKILRLIFNANNMNIICFGLMVHQNCLLDPRWWQLFNTTYSITQVKISLI